MSRVADAYAMRIKQEVVGSRGLRPHAPERDWYDEIAPGTVVIDLSEWWNLLDESIIQSLKQSGFKVSLRIVDIEHVEMAVFDLLGNLGNQIVELVLDSCDFLWAREVKTLIRQCARLEVLRLIRLSWVDDSVVEQLSVRYGKSLRALHIHRCGITNNALFHMGKRCSSLQSLSISCCNKVTDVGILEIAKNNHLSHIHLSHSMVIGDKSLAGLIGSANELKTLHIVNCPKITDDGFAFLYETQAAWGKRRNTAGASLKEVMLADDPAFTAQILLWLSTAAVKVEKLSIESIPMDLCKALSELYNLTELRHLTLGPSPKPVDPFAFNQYMSCHAETLLTLQLEGVKGMDDERIGELLDTLLSLQELSIADMPFGTSSIEAVCSSIPNIRSLSIAGSALFGDDELRCFASVCLHIQSLALSRCPAITDVGFLRFIALKMLTKLHLSSLAGCSGGVAKLLTSCPLTELSLEGMRALKCREVLPFLRRDTHWKLTKLSLQGSQGVEPSDCVFILNSFVRLRTLDVTLCRGLKVDGLQNLPHCNPFLSYQFSSDFSGWALFTAKQKRVYTQYWEIREQFRKHHAARLLQSLWRQYLLRLDQLKGLRREIWHETKVYWVCKIQAMWRGYIARRRFKVRLAAGRRIVRAARDCLFYWAYLKGHRAKMHYRRSLKMKLFAILRRHYDKFQATVRVAERALASSRVQRMTRLYFRKLLHLRGVFAELRFEYSAYAYWETGFLRKIYRYWRTSLYHTARRRQLLAKMFMLTLPLEVWNSSRLRHVIQIADGFRSKRLAIIAWIALANDRLLKKRAEALEPMAIEHFQTKFFKRMCSLIFQTVRSYGKDRRFKRIKKIYGARMHQLLSYRDACIPWDRYTLRRLMLKQRMERAVLHHPVYTSRFLLRTRFLPFVRNHVVFRHAYQRVYAHVKQRLTMKGFESFRVGVVRSRLWRIMQARANTAYKKHFYKLAFFSWNQYRLHCHNMEAFYVARYQTKLKRKMWRFFKDGIQISKEFAKMLALEIERQAASEGAYRAAIIALRVFQARIRGFVARKRFHEERIQKLYSIQTLQNFFRTYLARKEYASRLKKRHIAERVREDHENEAMKEEELHMLYFLYHDNAALAIQRVFRGYVGRKLYFVLAVDYYRRKNLEFYQENHHTRMHHQAYLRAAYLREQQRHLAATEIQRIVRGKLCRVRYIKIRRHALMVKKSVIVQRNYRRRLAKMKLMALRRDAFNDMRFREARERRGLVLRWMGATKRSSQMVLGRLLAELGLDPITFNHRVSELWAETKNDFHDFVDILKRERMLFKQHGFNRLNRMLERRKLLNDQGWKLHVQQAVKIVEARHPYEGYTGIIIRIDESVQGNPLYEVSLDKFHRQTFVRMTTDPLKIYETLQPLAKIDTHPRLPPIDQPYIVFGLDPEDEFFHRKNVAAAWKIQRAFRMHRARRITARKRYEHWMQNIGRQAALLQHLSQSNALNMHGYNIAQMLKLRSVKPIKFNEIRHKLRPGRLAQVVSKAPEALVINKELEIRLKDRQKFLQKSTLMQAKEYFATGHERLVTRRKFTAFLGSMFGMFYHRDKSLRDVAGGGARGLRYAAGRESLVSGMDRFHFAQFESSPHVRYYKTQLYQGEWAGVPLVTPMYPSGEGVLVFLDGWGFAPENKVLYLTILACRHLNAMDIATGSADPYCDIHCNGMTLQTTVKWTNLNPQYHESFEIDVTNPEAKLNIIVKDKDYFGSDDFMGQIELKLADFVDGRSYHATYQLKGEELNAPDDGFDRGEIEVRLRWAERKYDDDYAKQELRKVMLIKLQAWVRGLAAQRLTLRTRQERQRNMEFMFRSAVKITSLCRIRLAQKDYRRRLRRRRAAIKIQKRVRIWIAKRIYRILKQRKAAAIKIQARMRVYLAKAFVVRLKAQIAADLNGTATIIQKYVRRHLVKRYVAKMRVNSNLMEQFDAPKPPSAEEEEPVEVGREALVAAVLAWLPTYGVDPEYGLKRNRRITQRLFNKLLKTKFARLLTRYGIVYVDSYPPRKPEQGEIEEENVVEELINPNDFVGAFVPPFDVVRYHRKEAIERILQHEHLGLFHLPSSVYMRPSVHLLVTTVQCAFRQRRARKAYQLMLRMQRGIVLFQRLFRKRYEVYHRCAVKITSLFRRIHATKRVGHVRREYLSAVCIQCSYRCYRARCVMFDFRSVSRLGVLKSSPEAIEGHGPEKCLEHRDDTFWIAKSNEKAEVRVEFARMENITEVWVMTSTLQASPNFISIGAVLDKKSGYTELVDRQELPLLPMHRWHKFVIPVTTTKYFMLLFWSNYGDDDHIAVRQVRFVRSKESSATITRQPAHYILCPGPSVNERAEIVLRVQATGWPLPTYQWHFNGKAIDGATSTELKLSLFCPVHGARVYRCIRCKMVSRAVPLNAYHIKCGNCSYLFNYKEIDEFDKHMAVLKEREDGLTRSKTSLQASIVQMNTVRTGKSASVLEEAKTRLVEVEVELQKLREKRIQLKQQASHVNHFTDEGVYMCEVTNVRGGSLKIKRKSVGAVVLIEKPNPYVIDVIPMYVPRAAAIRKKWTIYSSILGNFHRGKLMGLARIRFNDGSVYEGPYIDEDLIDKMGHTLPRARKKNHFGIFKTADGRTFEGHNVDNHFDCHNLQTYYRARMANGEVYEGMFVDETFHGVGIYTYADGSVYEGRWHRGMRFGQGQLRSAEGWTYEGFFDTNRRHRYGVIDYPNGSCYMGDWYYDQITGRGIYVTPLKDVYRGELLNGRFHGQGVLNYADGSVYSGQFQDGLRHGRGVFIEREGSEFYGHFREDFYHGELVVKTLIAIEEDGQDNYEIRLGIYDMGRLVKWKSKFSNPIATKQFIALFRANRDMFDSVFSMILAKHLPLLPEGIDANNKKVRNIIFRIRLEAGMLVGEDAFIQAKRQIENTLKPLNEKKAYIAELQQKIEEVSTAMVATEKEGHHLQGKSGHFFAKADKNTSQIEQFWQDDPRQVRWNYILACRELYTVSTDDYFAFRNHRAVPTFVKKIVDALSYLLSEPTEWKEQCMLLSDAASNGRAGDEEALRLSYHCKLAFLVTFGNPKDQPSATAAAATTTNDAAVEGGAGALADPESNDQLDLLKPLEKKRRKYYDDAPESKMGWGLDVFQLLDLKQPEKLAEILADTRFRSDSYYIESTGVAGPVLVNWIRALHVYMGAARDLRTMMKDANDDRAAAFRLRAALVKKQDELAELTTELARLQELQNRAKEELFELEHALIKAQDLLEFIQGRYQFESADSKRDYYKLLEQKLEQKRDFFSVEVCAQFIVDKVVERAEKEKNYKRLQAFGAGVEFVDEDVENQQPSSILEWITEEVRAQQRAILDGGRSLGYGFEPAASDVTKQYTLQLVSLIVDIVIGKLNDKFNDLAAARVWVCRDGRRINSRFLYIFAWRVWEEEAVAHRDMQAVAAWGQIWGDEAVCARMAVEARVNQRMSSLARAQGKVWAAQHKQAVAYAESDLAAEFLAACEDHVAEAAHQALMVERETAVPGFDELAYSPSLRAQALCFCKLYPEAALAAKDAFFVQYATAFYDQFGLESGTIAYQLLNGLVTVNGDDDLAYAEAAQHWRDFNLEAYEAAGEALRREMSAEFTELYPLATATEAAKFVVHLKLAPYLFDDEARAQFSPNPKHVNYAYSYGMLHQGLLRAAEEALLKEYAQASNRAWTELDAQTVHFTKGSALLGGGEEDRFAGFRQRLASKCGFAYAFLCMQYDDASAEMARLGYVDPLEKVIHRVRPSEMKQTLYQREHAFLQTRGRLEEQLRGVIDKLAQWNSYFGWVSQELTPYEAHP